MIIKVRKGSAVWFLIETVRNLFKVMEDLAR